MEATIATRRGRKHDQVIAGARRVFLRDGYSRASVDEIAREAAVSKATLYSYFEDKEKLFTEVIQQECGRQADAAIELIDFNAPAPEVLRTGARHMVDFLLSEFGQRVFRICVAEAERFPDIARAFYESGPAHVRTRVIAFLETAIARGELEIDDVSLAADQFAELCKADLFMKVVFGIRSEFTEAEITRTIEGAVRTFMARYAAPGGERREAE